MRTLPLILFASTFCISCDAVHPSNEGSLVGAEPLPSVSILAHETVYIEQGGSAFGGHALIYVWHPDNSLVVTHIFSEPFQREIVLGEETLHLSKKVEGELRELIVRVHPPIFKGVEYYTKPTGCEDLAMDESGEVTIGFVKADAEGELGPGQVGIFTLPYETSCNTPAAIEARKVVEDILQLLPKSDVAVEYDKVK